MSDLSLQTETSTQDELPNNEDSSVQLDLQDDTTSTEEQNDTTGVGDVSESQEQRYGDPVDGYTFDPNAIAEDGFAGAYIPITAPAPAPPKPAAAIRPPAAVVQPLGEMMTADDIEYWKALRMTGDLDDELTASQFLASKNAAYMQRSFVGNSVHEMNFNQRFPEVFQEYAPHIRNGISQMDPKYSMTPASPILGMMQTMAAQLIQSKDPYTDFAQSIDHLHSLLHKGDKPAAPVERKPPAPRPAQHPGTRVPSGQGAPSLPSRPGARAGSDKIWAQLHPDVDAATIAVVQNEARKHSRNGGRY